MASQYKIIIENQWSQDTDFYAFQQQAGFQNSGGGLTILSSCVACGPLAPHASSGAQLVFEFDQQTYAGAKSTMFSVNEAAFNVLISLADSVETAMQTSAAQPIDLTPATGQSNNSTTMTVSPLGLSSPAFQSGLDTGSFGIEVPPYTSMPTPELYCGCAAINQDGSIMLSSFIAPRPNSVVMCAPEPVFFVKVGDFGVGQSITYDTSNAARCDFTQGFTVISVTYTQNGSFTIAGS